MRAATIAVILFAFAPSALADDDKQDEITVLPWTDATLAFSSADKRGAVSYAQTIGQRYGLRLKFSAPLDEDTRTAALADNNKLVGGFAASLQFGIDTRADYLASLADRTDAVNRALEKLAQVPPPLPISGPVTTEDFLKPLCTQATVDPCVAPDSLPKLCAYFFGGACDKEDDYFARAAEHWKTHCAVPTSDKCALAAYILQFVPRYRAFRAAEAFRISKKDFDSIVKVYARADSAEADKLKNCPTSATREQCVADRASEIVDKLRKLPDTEPLERRDFLLSAIPGDQWEYAIVANTAVSYDRDKIYQDDLTADRISASAYDFIYGLDFTLYSPVPGLSLNARVGGERSRETGATKVERCTPVTSSDPMVVGRECDSNALFRVGGPPEAENSGYARFAVGYQHLRPASDDAVIPGVEVRLNFEGIGQDLVTSTRLTLFATPVSGNTAARVGLAVDVRFEDPRAVITPMLFVGATLADLMSK